MLIAYDIINTIGFVILAFLFIGIFLPSKTNTALTKALLLLSWTIIEVTLIRILNDYLAIKSIIDIVLTIIFSFFLYKATVIKTVVLSILQYLIAASFEFFAYMVAVRFMGYIHLFDVSDSIFSIYGGVISQLLYLIVIAALMSIFKTDNYKKTNAMDFIKFSVFPIVTISLIFSFVYYSNGKILSSGEIKFYTYLSICFLIVNIYMFYLIKIDIDKRIALEKTALTKEYASELANLYQQITSEHKEISSIEHEYKNMLSVISTLYSSGQYDKLEEYLNNKKLSPAFTDIINTGNTIASAIINAKYAEASRRGIQMRFDIDNLSGLNIDDADLVIILSNLFNNAIEACELLSENKTIEIKIKSIDNLLFISFANPVCKSTIDTSKTNKHNNFKHGYGIQNIRRVVDSYNGNTNIDISDGIYTISIMLHS